MVTGLGMDPPAERMAGAARALAAAHARTRCRETLRFHAIGYSAGTIVTLEAAGRGLRLETAHMAGSPINAFGSALADAVREGRIRRVVNHASFVDGWVWALLGMGQLGYHGAPPDARLPIEDRWDITYHLAPPLDEARGAALADELLRDARARGDGPHICFREASFRAAFERTRRALRDAEMPPAPAAPPPTPPAAPPAPSAGASTAGRAAPPSTS
jgi:hypothetical protein